MSLPQNAAVRHLANGTNRADWRHRAACGEEDPDLFFPVGTSGPALLQIAEAKTVCRRCPVNAECLNWAFGSGQDSGIWGGMSEDERRAVRRRDARERLARDAAEYHDQGHSAAWIATQLGISDRHVRRILQARRDGSAVAS